jgi:RNA polymerase sigma-70 factor (ECF subfamily)
VGSETDVLARIQAGDLKGAAEHLVHAYADEVMGMCTAMVRNRTIAEDLTQDVFGRAFANLAGFRGEASPRTWLLRIARNRCIDHLRAAKRDPWGGIALDVEEPDTQPDDTPLPSDLLVRRDDVNDALAELAEGDRALVVLRFRNGLDYSELAMAFGIKEGTVRMRVSRALARMRRFLEAKHAEPEQRAVAPRASAPSAPAPSATAGVLDEANGAAPPPAASAAEEMADLAEDEMELAEPEDLLAASMPPAQAPAPKRSAPGLLARLTDVFRREPPPSVPSGPPPQHPLTAFFAASHSPLSEQLRTQLLARARSAEG